MPVVIESQTTRSKTRPHLLSLLITRILTTVADEGVPYQRTIFREKSEYLFWEENIFFGQGVENRREKNILANTNTSDIVTKSWIEISRGNSDRNGEEDIDQSAHFRRRLRPREREG